MAEYTSFTPWTKQIEDLKPSVRSKRYKVTPSGRHVRLINAQGKDEGTVAFINSRGTLGGGAPLMDKLKPILNGPTDEERETKSTATAYRVGMPKPIAVTTLSGTGSLKAFARSGAGGLRNEQNEEAAITELQEFLASLGQDTGGIDGKYGPKTNAAVLKFQNAVGLKTDGDAGPNTIAKIIDIQNDLKEIERLLQKLLKESITDISKFGYYKSTLMNTLLETDLSTAELDRLKQLQSKYEPFVQEFPEFKADIFQKVNTAIQANGQSQFGLSNNELT